ncbi:DUF1656 domain-containing protein [Methylobacterium sp. J-043]|jgi:hypothetical protein|uniref:DUF1656 domain-containing protein n=1 Tax=Methylorubrum TaxID=2282523 RepID=UPI00209D0CEB|nr:MULTISPECIES: DUF1656 domain-containing protein [Methylorubrum]MCJ2031025.1 DUF1656 domain-containing protein [Methylobacterium sp. J-043]MCP1550808.1 hypothetical protein [Methylorubrum zatmanii]MCP1552579.1 hypothetical protein [Methylorubrum extorquens]MCP1581111.1 hypothetical protein [Methylorubrum extorquens]
MQHDLAIGGILISPFVAYALIAFALLVALRVVFRWIRFGRFVANPPLAEAGIYVCLLALVVVLL